MRRLVARLSGVLLCAVLCPAVAAEDSGVGLTILYTSGLQGQFDRMLGVASLARQARQEGRWVLLLDAGDALSPSEAAFTHPDREGSLTVDLLNRAGYDGWLLGAVDLDRPSEALTEGLRQTRFPVLGANLHRPDTGRFLFQVQPYTVLRRQGVRIGIVGVSAGDGGMLRGDPGAAAWYYAPLLREQADVVVLLTHLGFEADSLLAVSVPGIDVIVDGALPPGREMPQRVNGVLICGNERGGQRLGRLDLTVSEGKVKDGACQADEVASATGNSDDLVTALSGWTAQVDGKRMALTDVLGAYAGGFEGAAAGHLIADLMRTTTASDMALVLASDVGANLPEGPVRVVDLYRVYSRSHRLVTVFLRGGQVLALLERSLAPSGPLFLVSGLEVAYDRSVSEGEAMVSVTVGGQPLDRDQVYRVALEERLTGRGRVERIAEVLRPVERREIGVLIRDMLARHIQAAGVVRGAVETRTRVR